MIAAQPLLLDTCAAIWLVNGDPMSANSRDAIVAAQTNNIGVYVSPMTAWEIATLVAKRRLHLTLSQRIGSMRCWGWQGYGLLRCLPRF